MVVDTSTPRELLLLLWTSFLLTFSALLPLINPLGSALVFMGLMGDVPAELYRSMARRIAINNIIFLAIIELLGSAILKFFGISLPIVQVAGGVVISSIGWGMLNEKDARESTETRQREAAANLEAAGEGLQQKAFYPFTFPVTSGPGTIVVLLTLNAHVADPSIERNVLGHVGLLLAVIVLSALVYICYAYSPRLTAAVRPSTVHGILRVMAFIVFCIGVQIAWNGLAVLLPAVMRR
jgi:multiple antibiotic resistance protein